MSGEGERDKYRDNDDVRDVLSSDDRGGTQPDTKSEARGDARAPAFRAWRALARKSP
jgi:hypothetical protein